LPRLFSRAINLQIVHDDVAFALNSEKNERVRHEHPDRVKHVGVVVAVGNDE
jgi:hypothetical protein